jgi:two-component system, NtrC family, nitrogen regulation response regulator GlnG
LLAEFLIAELATAPQLIDQTTSDTPRLPASAVAPLLRRRWPGNVRELRNAARQLAADMRASDPLDTSGLGGRALDLGAKDAAAPPPEPPRSVAPALDEARLLAALRAHRFQLNRTAHALGISRTHLDAHIAHSPHVRKAKDLTREEIEACRQQVGDELDAMAAQLEVSARGLRLRMSQLGM